MKFTGISLLLFASASTSSAFTIPFKNIATVPNHALITTDATFDNSVVKTNLPTSTSLASTPYDMNMNNMKSNNGRASELYQWCTEKRWGKVQGYLESDFASDMQKKQKLMYQDKIGYTALHHACFHDAPDVVIASIINFGGKDLAMKQTRDGVTALHFACSGDAPLGIIRHLLQYGGRELAMATDFGNRTALFCLCANVRKHRDAAAKIRLLLEVGNGRELLRTEGQSFQSREYRSVLEVAQENNAPADVLRLLGGASAARSMRDGGGMMSNPALRGPGGRAPTRPVSTRDSSDRYEQENYSRRNVSQKDDWEVPGPNFAGRRQKKQMFENEMNPVNIDYERYNRKENNVRQQSNVRQQNTVRDSRNMNNGSNESKSVNDVNYLKRELQKMNEEMQALHKIRLQEHNEKVRIEKEIQQRDVALKQASAAIKKFEKETENLRREKMQSINELKRKEEQLEFFKKKAAQAEKQKGGKLVKSGEDKKDKFLRKELEEALHSLEIEKVNHLKTMNHLRDAKRKLWEFEK